MKVTSPDGREWRVGRRWLPWRRRARDLAVDSGSGWDVPDGDDPVSVVLGIVVVVLVLPFALALTLVVGELLLLLLLLPVVLLLRLVLRRPWVVEVVRRGPGTGPRVVHSRAVVGWRASGEAVAAAAHAIRSGDVPVVAAEAAPGAPAPSE